jgi:hypothetical protein
LKPNGLIDCHYTPASLQGATNEMARQEGEKLVQYLKEARVLTNSTGSEKMKPISSVCAIGVNPSNKRSNGK